MTNIVASYYWQNFIAEAWKKAQKKMTKDPVAGKQQMRASFQ